MKHLKMKSPVGVLTLVANESGLCAVLWEEEKKGRVKIDIGVEAPKDEFLLDVKKQLNEFFARERVKFQVKLDLQGTDFQKNVWRALMDIPYGKTASYLEIAKKLGKPTASRAVGMANGRNPISIIIPCHRVIGANGGLTGYAGGVEAKQLLLTLEINDC